MPRETHRSEVTVNNVHVVTDKAIRDINDNMITFADGSWCNVRTREVENRGPGKIVVDGVTYLQSTANLTKKSEDSWTTLTKTYDARDLRLDAASVDVIIEPGDLDQIEVVYEGPADMIGSFSMTIEDGLLHLVQSSAVRLVQAKSWWQRLLTQLSISASLTINGYHYTTAPMLRIKMPTGRRLTLNDCTGNVTVGDLRADLYLHTASGDVDVDRVQNAYINAGGSGDVTIGRVSEEAEIQLSGSGDVDITDGTLLRLWIRANGSGDVTVARVTGIIDVLMTSSGDVEIEDGTARPVEGSVHTAKNRAPLTVVNRGSGDFTFEGTAHDAKLTLEGVGDIEVDRVVGQLTTKRTGSGDIEVCTTG